jgi:hypothetical protein
MGPMNAARRFVIELQQFGLLSQVTRVCAQLYGSLALTGKGHCTDRAVLLGLEGADPASIDIGTVEPSLERIRATGRLRLLGCHEIEFDEPMELLFHRDQAPAENRVPDADNLYILLAGIDAPAGRSIREQGLENVRAFQDALRAAADSTQVPIGVGRTPESSRYQVDLGVEPWSLADSVWDRIKRREIDVQALTTKYAEGLERYRQLHAARGYYDVSPSVLSGVIYFPNTSLRRLFLSQIAYELQSGQPERQEAALADLSRDFELWVLMLQGEGPLISKMLAIAFIHGNLALLSDAIADAVVPVDRLHSGAAAMLELEPLDTWRISSVWNFELRFTADTLRAIEAEPRFLADDPTEGAMSMRERAMTRAASLFLLPNNTLNLSAERFDELVRVSAAPITTLQVELNALEERRSNDKISSMIGRIRNPTGKLLVGMSSGAYSDYVLRPYDVAAYQRAVRLAFELRSAGVERSGVASFMDQHPEWSRHPVGAEAFALNGEPAAVVVKPVSRSTANRRFDVRLFRTNDTPSGVPANSAPPPASSR